MSARYDKEPTHWQRFHDITVYGLSNTTKFDSCDRVYGNYVPAAILFLSHALNVYFLIVYRLVRVRIGTHVLLWTCLVTSLCKTTGDILEYIRTRMHSNYYDINYRYTLGSPQIREVFAKTVLARRNLSVNANAHNLFLDCDARASPSRTTKPSETFTLHR